ncbi:MAG: energy transducer TonB, partial [Litorimonas sp.]
ATATCPIPAAAQFVYEEPVLINKPVPPMPLGAGESGYCCVSLDVSAEGRAENAQVGYCTLEIFRKATEWSVRKWAYEPARAFGEPVPHTDHPGFVSFIVAYEDNGEIVPSHSGYLTPKGDNPPAESWPQDAKAHKRWMDRHYQTDKVCGAVLS